MFHSRAPRGLGLIFLVVFACWLLMSINRVSGQTTEHSPPLQEAPAKTESAATPSPAATPGQNEELSSHDTPTTFKVRVNLVLVRVVVRDSQGKVIPNLKKEVFQLYDTRKLQAISSFNVEPTEMHTVSAVASTAEAGFSSSADAVGGKAVILPQRFVSMVFDDVHLSLEDSVFVRDSATRFFGALAASDRVSLNTTSGQLSQEFTDDHDKLARALLGIVPRSLTGANFHDCPDLSYYQADLIVNKSDPQAFAVATEEALQCAFQGNPTLTAAAQSLAQAAADRAATRGDIETQYAYSHLQEGVRRLASMPGQRVLVLVSPGFLSTTLQSEASEMVDRATRAKIVINTLDEGGPDNPDVQGDIADPPKDTFRTAGFKSSYPLPAQFAQEEVLAQLADCTGGKVFHNPNDVDEAMRESGAPPSLSALLGFSPQNLKIDGRFHTLKVALTSKGKFDIQA